MRTLIVAPWGEALGGAEAMLLTLLAHRDRAELEIEVAFLQDGPFVGQAQALGARTHVVPSGRLREPRRLAGTIRRLAGLIDDRRPEVVLAWSAKTHLYAAPAARRARHRTHSVWWQHGVPEGNWIDRLATRLPAVAVGCSSHASALAQQRLSPRRPTFVVHPGIAEPPPPSDAVGGAQLRARLGVDPGAVVVGLVGRLQPWKGQDRFLHALALLRQRGLPVHGLLVGGDAYGLSPAYAREIELLVDRLGLREATTMTGQVPEAAPYLAAMDVLVNASEAEPFGIVLLEGMACGLPVVAVARGGPLEIVEPSRTGVLVPSGSPRDLADGLAPLVADAALREQLGRAGRQRYLEDFTAPRMAQRLARELAGITGG